MPEMKFKRRKGREIMEQFPRLRKPLACMTTLEIEEEERAATKRNGGIPRTQK